MSYQFYLVLHLFGIFLILTATTAMAFHMAGGGTKANWPLRKFAGGLHGAGLVIALVAGFGLLAKLGFGHSVPVWAIAKLVIWLILGAMPALIYRKGANTKRWIYVTLLLAITACGLAAYKPGTSLPSNPDTQPGAQVAPAE